LADPTGQVLLGLVSQELGLGQARGLGQALGQGRLFCREIPVLSQSQAFEFLVMVMMV